MSIDSNSDSSYQNGPGGRPLPPKVFGNSCYNVTDQVKVYKTRWFILLVYCINGVLQNAMWNTWGPIEATARAVYKWDSYVIDLMAAWGSITFCLTMVPFAWIMDVKGKLMWAANYWAAFFDTLPNYWISDFSKYYSAHHFISL